MRSRAFCSASRLRCRSKTPPHFEALTGGRIVAHHVDAHRLLFTVGIELDRTLKVGDTIIVSVRADQPRDPNAARSLEIATRREVQKAVLWVRFHPDAVPDWVRVVEVGTDGAVETPRLLDTPTSIHHARWRFGPGSLALRWGYGPAPLSTQ